jgi:hypothetical protein
VSIDDRIFFDEDCFELEVQSPQRSVIQKSAAGLDGQVSIDLGLRRRKLIQKGELRAKSQTELQKKIDEINEIIDGETHIFKNADGRVFENLVIEEFKTGKMINGGVHTSCQYEIIYSQQG